MNNLYLKNFIRCKRKAWLDLKGNRSETIWSPNKAIETINKHKIFYRLTQGDLYSGIKACERGCKGVIGLKIKGSLRENVYAEIHPQLLLKTNGISKWGTYQYTPAVYKLGHRITKEHLFDLSFCSILLEKFQESKVNKGLVISDIGNNIDIKEIYLNKKLRNKVLNVFFNLNESLRGSIPEITEDRKKCAICSWQKFCDQEAKDNGYLTDIDGIGSKTAILLKKNGLIDTKDLAYIDEKKLEKKFSIVNTKTYEKLSHLKKQAKSYISGEPISINKNHDLKQLVLKKNSGFFIFDIESNPDEKHDFLYGFLELNNLFDEIEDNFYKPILQLKNNNKETQEKIMRKIFSKKDYPILHYGETEKIAIYYLAKKLKYDTQEIELIKTRFIDLHTLVRNSWILPIKNYTLKKVANFTGFEWTQKNVSGSKALYWWLQYQITKQDVFLNKIIKYNKDDCLATHHIAKWLILNQKK